MRTRDEIESLLAAAGGVIARRDHPELLGAIEHLRKRHELVAVLPGIYASAGMASESLTRMRAVMLKHPDAVLLRASAAQVSFWPEARGAAVEVAIRGAHAPTPGFTFCRRTIPPELVVERGGLRFTSPALTAVDLATLACADAIDTALRTRTATLDGMYEALRLTPNRLGNVDRRRVLLDSRHEPWSAAERLAHRAVRADGLIGWQTNWPVVVAGLLYFIDIAFPAHKLAIEIDGRLHETDADVFQSDRWRQNALVAQGWRVVRFTWEMVRDHPEVMIATIRRLLTA